MDFIDARINEHYLFGFTGGPQWNTMRNDLANGHVRKNKSWKYPLGKWTANYALLTPDEREAMRAAFWVCGGGFADFRFRDYDDFQAIEELFGIGDGSATPMQLVRNYTFGSVSFSRPIRLPLAVQVRDQDGATLAVTVDPLTGMATPDTAWPDGKELYWTGEFDVRACFESDYNPFTYERSNRVSFPVTIIESRG